MAKLKMMQPRLAGLSDSRLAASGGISGSARQAKGKSSAARGYGYRWQQARKAFLTEFPLCALCSTDDSPVLATVVDHKIPHGGNDDLFWDQSNWQPLCQHCHSSTKQRQEWAARQGRGC